MGLTIKNIDVLRSILSHKCDIKLEKILAWWEQYVGDFVITEFYRPQRHGNDLHGVEPVRAIDLRSWIYSDPEWVCNRCNLSWVYDPNRPEKKVCVYHNAGSGKHFHIQVHPNTRRRRTDDTGRE